MVRLSLTPIYHVHLCYRVKIRVRGLEILNHYQNYRLELLCALHYFSVVGEEINLPPSGSRKLTLIGGQATKRLIYPIA